METFIDDGYRRIKARRGKEVLKKTNEAGCSKERRKKEKDNQVWN